MVMSVVALAVTLPLLGVSPAQAEGTRQTLTFLGGVLGSNPVGTVDTTTDYTRDGGQTWEPAYLIGSHPWGLVDGTDSWIHWCPSGTESGPDGACLADAITYRVRFFVPPEFSDPQLALQIKVDNWGTVFLNGQDITGRVEGQPQPIDAEVTAAMQVGLNEMTMLVEGDGAGWSGFNYRADISVIATQPLVPIEAGVEAPLDPYVELTGPVPADVMQAVEMQPGGTCADVVDTALAWGGAPSGGWAPSWAQWARGGLGGPVCERSLYWTRTGQWLVRP